MDTCDLHSLRCYQTFNEIIQIDMVTQLTAINWAKAVTIALIFALITLFGIDGQRQILYACMHISYCLWWLIEQKIYPDRRQQIFTEKVGV